MNESELETGRRGEYQRQMLGIRGAFLAGATGQATVAARGAAVDALVTGLWGDAAASSAVLREGVALVAVGGYGRSELFPYSDVDLLFVLDGKVQEKDVKQPIRRLCQELWDSGVRLSPVTRRRGECERLDGENAEFALALMDHRLLAGDAAVYGRLAGTGLPKLLQKENKALTARLIQLTDERHRKYGDTLFHLEPNLKDCPGGLRDLHVCSWLEQLAGAREGTRPRTAGESWAAGDAAEFQQAREFLFVVRCFLHLRHERDDNVLDWQAQDAAAKAAVGLGGWRAGPDTPDPAYWMRFYFRHARSVERRLEQMLDALPAKRPLGRLLRSAGVRGRRVAPSAPGVTIEDGRAVLAATGADGGDPAHDPDAVLGLFGEMSRTGCALERGSEERISNALPLLSAHLEEGPALWRHLREILLGRTAGETLRAMHALGILELLIPEFHGIDALVIRDAYHRYTVDEHTMVVIDTLHGLEEAPAAGGKQVAGSMAEWAPRFAGILRDVQHPALLYLAALLHDTGKGRSTGDHAQESARMAENLLQRLELDAYEAELVIGLIRNHLEMSSALRRDIFDGETVRAFAGKVQTPEALRMLTLFTYADIGAVHPDALTPWKAENIWRLFLATANFLDRSVDDDRVGSRVGRELVRRVTSLVPAKRTGVEAFLAGFPERYLRTRTPEQVRTHFEMAERFAEDPVQLEFRYSAEVSEITLLTPDRELLFADMAGCLAAWGMNIVTADAFSNRQGVVVDSFRFTDSFRTLEMNASEHMKFLESMHDAMSGKTPVEKMLSGRRRGRRAPAKMVVDPRVDFDDEASSHSTLLQVVAPDVPGLLRAVSLALARRGCNIEVALVDTEGETAIDVFYVTRNGMKLDREEQEELRRGLLGAIEENAR
ncbi:MAG: [protein-PII] uridylyltransferase [Acidobacteriota bacterium]|nr:[protein-PII] uridylyltransferase [Acidobacteriota bacterium]